MNLWRLLLMVLLVLRLGGGGCGGVGVNLHGGIALRLGAQIASDGRILGRINRINGSASRSATQRSAAPFPGGYVAVVKRVRAG
jgi:hypothetical protein